MSCNGCRVLRKGCSSSCVLRPCIQWIESATAQANATAFVAKFFGRSTLLSLLSSVPLRHRPAAFRSLLYEACGRTINPVGGATGLLWMGWWQLCLEAVETVLCGGTIRPLLAEVSGIATAIALPGWHQKKKRKSSDQLGERSSPANGGHYLSLSTSSDSSVTMTSTTGDESETSAAKKPTLLKLFE
ncbi:LOB domain-containing protein 37-like [Curcuma longa]|uniref:LOB domain-containing protein 37-like n=1 Tax=Curcuma longa TaxID=136217 RepID=UPI003D9EA686